MQSFSYFLGVDLMAFSHYKRRNIASIKKLGPGEYLVTEDGTPRGMFMGTNAGNVEIPTYGSTETAVTIRQFHAAAADAVAADADGAHAAVTDTGEEQTITEDITNPAISRNMTATAGGTTADIGAIQVTFIGTNDDGEEITEILPPFTENTAGTVSGSKAFTTVTAIVIPAHDGTGATTAIGWGDVLGLPWLLSRKTNLYKQTFLNNVAESTEPTITVSASAIESNTIDLNSALNGTAVDAYFIVDL
jgi:hypothetical protein